MYGHIHMMKTKPIKSERSELAAKCRTQSVRPRMPLNMFEELFLAELRDSITYYIAKGAQDRAKQSLRLAKTADDRMLVLSAFMKVCIAENNLLEAVAVTEDLLKDPQMIFHRSRLLFYLGDLSERLYDFDRAIGYYCRSLACVSRPDDLHDLIWNNLGFCWLYKRDFKTAEQCCRQAVDLNRNSWEAWKNLGVSLEHQQRIEEAFLAYIKAVVLSRGRAIPVMHLTRLSQRHPAIASDVSDLRPTVYREYLIVL